jgi:hypothetical protein
VLPFFAMKSAQFWVKAGISSGPTLGGPAFSGARLVLTGLVLLLGCDKVSEAKAGGAVSAASMSQELAVAAAPSFDNANYSAVLRPSGACKKGETCAVEVSLVAKGDYHINDKYPYKFKVDDPAPGVKYPKPVVGKDDGVMEEKKLLLKVPFIAETAGDKRVAGTLSLSVCSAANCLMDKQPLEVTVKVE